MNLWTVVAALVRAVVLSDSAAQSGVQREIAVCGRQEFPRLPHDYSMHLQLKNVIAKKAGTLRPARVSTGEHRPSLVVDRHDGCLDRLGRLGQAGSIVSYHIRSRGFRLQSPEVVRLNLQWPLLCSCV
jgi:hypothetical protein